MKKGWIIFAIGLMAGCSQSGLDNITPKSAKKILIENSATLQPRSLKILDENCTSCHGQTNGPSNVDDLMNVPHLIEVGLILPGDADHSPLLSSVEKGFMPPRSTLAKADQVVLRKWIQSLRSAAPAKPNPAPKPAPGTTPRFQEVEATVFQVSCTRCHSTANPAAGHSFETYDQVLKEIDLKEPEESTAYSVSASGEMPIGGPAVTKEQLQLLLDWIKAGAPNN